MQLAEAHVRLPRPVRRVHADLLLLRGRGAVPQPGPARAGRDALLAERCGQALPAGVQGPPVGLELPRADLDNVSLRNMVESERRVASLDQKNPALADEAKSLDQVAADLKSGFGGFLQSNKTWNGVKQGVHTPPSVQCSSLVAVRVPKPNLVFTESFGKLKATLNDGFDSYQLTVSSKALKEAWRNGGLVGVTNALPARNELHVRVGLARPFDNPPKCYAMLNGVL